MAFDLHLPVARRVLLQIFDASGRVVSRPIAGDLFSLVATCKAFEINPVAYLEDVLQRMDTG